MAEITATYISPSGFTVETDRTDEFCNDRRIKADHDNLEGGGGNDGFKFGTITSSSYASGANATTVNLTVASDDLTANLVKVYYGLVSEGSSGSVPIHSHNGNEGSGGVVNGATHTIASHSDTTATGTELEELTDGSDTTLHDHDGISENTGARHAESHNIASHSDTSATGTELETLTDNSIANTLHRHSELVASDGSPDPALSVDTAGGISTNGSNLQINTLGSGNRYSHIDLVGDDTYSDYGLRIIRGNTGANAATDLYHRGTGNFNIVTQEAAQLLFKTTNTTRLTIAADGNITISGGLYLATDEVRARDSGGLLLRDNSGNTGIFIEDGGCVGIGTDTPTEKLEVSPDTDVSAVIGKAHIGLMGHYGYAGFSHVNKNGANDYAILHGPSGNLYINASTSASIFFRNNNVNVLQINSTGMVFATGTTINEFSTDGTLAGDSDDAVPTEKAVATAINTKSDNVLINQTFSIWQENTTFTNPTAGIYTADGYMVNKVDGGGTAPSVNVKKNTSVHEDAFTQSCELEITAVGATGATRAWSLYQKIEDFEKYRGKTVTFSIRIKASVVIVSPGKITVYDGVSATDFAVTSVGTDWVTYSATRAINSAATLLTVYYNLISGAGVISTTGSIYIQWMKLELGSVATPLIPRSTGEELALCQRYYQKSYAQGTFAGAPTDSGIIYARDDNLVSATYTMYLTTQLPVMMKAAPTVTIYDNIGNSGRVRMSSGGNIVGTVTCISENSFVVYATNGGANTIHLLGYHYTAISRI